MRPEATPWLRLWRRIPATCLQLWLEIKLVTGGRPLALLIVAEAWFAVFTAWALLRPDPWDADVYYNLMLVAPGSILTVALGMGAIIGERDTRQLETTFVSPTGRYSAWVHRLVAVVLAVWIPLGLLSLQTWVIVDRGHPPLLGWLHSLVHVLVLLSLTTLLSLVFKSAAGAGLGAGGYLVFWLIFGDISRRFTYWFNPFAEIRGVNDPAAFFRILVFNRSLLLALAGLGFALSFWLLQRRERLL